MVIDKTYFIRELNIAQLSDVAVAESLDLFIAKYEPIFLKRLFGPVLGAEILIGSLEEQPSPIIEFLLDGGLFEQDGNIYTWDGLRNANKISPIANFVFFHFVNDRITQQSGIGEVKPLGQNSEVVSADERLVMVWNEMIT
jgi:hypothetical protein